MDEAPLRRLLDSALASEPPMWPVADDSLRAGIKLRRRRRAWGASPSAAVVALIAVAIPGITGVLSDTSAAHPARVPRHARARTAYVVGGRDTVTPIATATNTPGKPIKVGKGPWAIAITPDGKTAYVLNANSDTVTPIATATNTPGPPIPVGYIPYVIAIGRSGAGVPPEG
jgi:YVTN family beta-propeller protein